jgi:conjugal transfer pilus assembly protein TraV
VTTRRHLLQSTRCAAALCGVLLAGCANITGLDASSEYACQAPLGVQCESVSGTYANALRNSLPAQRPQRAPSAAPAAATPATTAKAAATRATSAAARAPGGVDATPAVQPIRSQPRLLRLWIKPWEDADRDLHDQGYVYVQVDSGRWLVDHAQRQVRDAYAPVRPPRRPAAAAPADEPTAQRPQAAGVPAAEALRSLQAARPYPPRGPTE